MDELIQMIAGGAIVLVAGYLVGWWFRGLTFMTQRAVQDELWTRKLKFAEQEALDAQAQATRFGAQHPTQEKAMQAAREYTEELEAEISARTEALRDAEQRLETELQRSDKLSRDLARHEEY